MSSSAAVATLPTSDIECLAALLHAAQQDAREIEKITDQVPALSIADAYAIQNAILARQGGRMAGRKMGLTSFAKMQQMGVDKPIHGFLIEAGRVEDGAQTPMRGLIHPKCEAEIAVVTSRELKGPNCSTEEALGAIGEVFAAIEVIDSRYRNFRFDLPSVIADNTSAARFVVGAQGVPAQGLDLAALEVSLTKNGEVLATGTGAAVLGHPATSLAALVNLLAEQGQVLPAGTLVLTGAITEAFAAQAGDEVQATVQGVGTARLRFV